MKKNRLWMILAVCVLVVCTLALTAVAGGGTFEKTVYVGTYSGTDSDGTIDKPYTDLNAAIEAINAAKDANDSITDGKIIVKDDITVVGTDNVTLTACKVPLVVTSADPANRSKLTLNTHTSKRILTCTSEIEFNNVIFLVSRSTYTEIWSGPSLTFGENVSTYSGTTTEAPASDYFCVRMNGANPSFTMLSGTLNVLQGGNNSGNVTGTSTIVLGGTAKVTHIMQCSGTSKSVAAGDVTIEGNAHVANLYINGHGTSKIDNVDITITGATVDNIAYHRTTDTSATSSSVTLTLDNAAVGSLAAKDSRVANAELVLRNGDYSSLTTTGWAVAKSVYVNQSYTGGDGVGTYAKPYASIETAVSSLNSGENAELVIVGTYKPSIVWAFPTHSTGKITVTGYDENAKIYVDATSKNDKPYWDFSSNVEFHDLTIAYNHYGKSMEIFAGPNLVFGNGMTFLCDDCTSTNGIITSSQDGHICVRMGKRAVDSECVESKFSISSGTISYVQGGSRYGEVGDSYITIGGTAVITDHVQGSGTFHSVDNSHITITGGTIAQLAVGGYGQTGDGKGPAKVIESSTISITGGTVNKITAYRGSTQSNDVINSIDMTIGGTAVVETMDISGVNITGTNNLTINNNQTLTSGFGTFWDSITIGTGATVNVTGTLSMTQKNDQDANVLTVKDGATLRLGVSNTTAPAYTKEGTGQVVLEAVLAAKRTEVYLDQSKGLVLGDGSADGSAAKPVSTLADAYAILQDGTGTIHLVGEYAITDGSTVFVFPYHNGKVTIQGTDANAKINFNTSEKTLVQFSSATELKNLQWRYAHNGGNMDIYSGPDLAVQEGVSFHCDGCGSIGDNCIAIRGGYQKAAYQNAAVTSNDVAITVNSGTISYVMGGNGVTDIEGNATINIGGTAVITTRVMSAGANGGSVKGDVTINITGGEIKSTGTGKGLVLIGHGSASKTCTVDGNVTVNISGGKVSQITTNRTDDELLKGDLTVNISGTASVGDVNLDKTFITEAKAQNLNFGDNIGELKLSGSFGNGWDSITVGDNTVIRLMGTYVNSGTLNMEDGSVLYLNSENGINTAVPAYNKTGAAQTGKVELKEMHNVTFVAAKAPGVLEGGNREHYKCAACGKYFTDAAATNEVDWEDLYIESTGYEYHHYTDGKNFTITKLMTASGGQGNAIYGNIMITANSVGSANMYDLTTGTHIASFRLGSYNGGTLPDDPDVAAGTSAGHWTNHSNQIMFGATKFDESDPFPLLYITTGNSGGHDGTGAYISKCAVERILQKPDGTWYAEIVQIIEFNDYDCIPEQAGNANKNMNSGNGELTNMFNAETGKFMYLDDPTTAVDESRYQKVGWGWAASFVDSKPTADTAGKFYLYSARFRTTLDYQNNNTTTYGIGSYWDVIEATGGTVNAYIITEFNMPALPTSVDDPAYGGTVTLYPKDIIDQFETEYEIGVTQGGTMYGGRIYYSYGWNGAPSSLYTRNGIQVFDIAQKKIVSKLALYETELQPMEPECCSIWNGHLVLGLNGGGYQVYVFDYVALDEATVVDPTCTEDGITYIECSLCGHNLKTLDTEEALDHSFTNYVSDNNATCETDGTKTAVCDRDDCGETDTVTETGTKLDHSFTDYKSDGNATCTVDGTKTAKCDRCDETDTVKEAAFGHKLTKVDGKAATCTEAGVTEHYNCSVCKKNFADAEGKTEKSDITIAAGHAISKVDGKAPTETENGHKEHYACASCGKLYADAEGKTDVTRDSLVISATGAPTDTGDDFEAWPFIILMLLSAAGVMVLVIGRKQWFKKSK